jgi:imidazolonepropionase-like amidohydrolase
MKSNYFIAFLLLLLVFNLTVAQQTPANSNEKTISIVGATAHIGNGSIIEEAIVILEGGMIKEIGKESEIEPEGTIIDAKNQHVYPGLILPNSTLGLGEIDLVRATRDFDELGSLLPHVRSLIAYNAESKVVESMRPNGILLAQVTPRGGRISGTSSIVQLDAWNWEDAAIRIDDGLHINWPRSYSYQYASFGRTIISEENKDYQKEVNELKDFLSNAKAYKKESSKKENLPFGAAQGIFSGKQKVFIHVDKQKGIIDAISLMKSMGVNDLVLVGADEAYKTMDLIKNKKVSVLLKRVHSLPGHEDDDYDLPYKNAVTLFQHGILVGLENSGGMERMNGRNLPFYAGTTTAYGLSFEEALQLITFNNAKILGIEKQYGSLEKGKSATLFISKGNALDMRGNFLSRAFIDGRDISLETHQTKLWKRYMEKFSHATE